MLSVLTVQTHDLDTLSWADALRLWDEVKSSVSDVGATLAHAAKDRAAATPRSEVAMSMGEVAMRGSNGGGVDGNAKKWS